MHAILRRRPEPTADYTQSHVGRGADYDEGFASMPLRALMWELEQSVLGDLVRRTTPPSTRALCPGGHLLLNNHRNFWSGSYLARHSLGVLPQADGRAYGVPTTTATRVERLSTRRFSSLHTSGTNTIWLLRGPPGRPGRRAPRLLRAGATSVGRAKPR